MGADAHDQHFAADAAVEVLDHAVGLGRIGLGLAVLDAELAAGGFEAVKQLPRSVSTWVTLKGKAATASLRKAVAQGSVSSSLTARWTMREARSIAT
jgi:hypothetical protein